MLFNKTPKLMIRYDNKIYDPLEQKIYEEPFQECEKSFFEKDGITLGALAYNRQGNTYDIVGISFSDSKDIIDPMKIGPLMVAHETLRILKSTSETITIRVQNDDKVKTIWDKTQQYVFEKVTGYYQDNIEAGVNSKIADYSVKTFDQAKREADIAEFEALLSDYIKQI